VAVTESVSAATSALQGVASITLAMREEFSLTMTVGPMLNLDLESERQTFLANAEVALCVGLLACTCTAWFTGIGNGRRRLHRWHDAAGGARQLGSKSSGRLDVSRQYAFGSSWSAPPPSEEALLEQALTTDTQLQVDATEHTALTTIATVTRVGSPAGVTLGSLSSASLLPSLQALLPQLSTLTLSEPNLIQPPKPPPGLPPFLPPPPTWPPEPPPWPRWPPFAPPPPPYPPVAPSVLQPIGVFPTIVTLSLVGLMLIRVLGGVAYRRCRRSCEISREARTAGSSQFKSSQFKSRWFKSRWFKMGNPWVPRVQPTPKLGSPRVLGGGEDAGKDHLDGTVEWAGPRGGGMDGGMGGGMGGGMDGARSGGVEPALQLVDVSEEVEATPWEKEGIRGTWHSKNPKGGASHQGGKGVGVPKLKVHKEGYLMRMRALDGHRRAQKLTKREAAEASANLVEISRVLEEPQGMATVNLQTMRGLLAEVADQPELAVAASKLQAATAHVERVQASLATLQEIGFGGPGAAVTVITRDLMMAIATAKANHVPSELLAEYEERVREALEAQRTQMALFERSAELEGELESARREGNMAGVIAAKRQIESVLIAIRRLEQRPPLASVPPMAL